MRDILRTAAIATATTAGALGLMLALVSPPEPAAARYAQVR